MIPRPLPRPTASDWTDALLTSGTEALIGAMRNYIGPIKTPYDKRELVTRLEAFLRRKETRDSMFSLLDPLDLRVIGTSLLLGPVPEQALKDVFLGEMPLFELGVKIANLLDRLLLFRYKQGGHRLIGVNPLLEDELRVRSLESEQYFGRPAAADRAPGTELSSGASASVDAKAVIAFFSYLFHAPFSTRKGGGLTKRAGERAASLFPGFAEAEGDRLGALTRALAATGILRGGAEEERSPDREGLSRLLSAWGEDLPIYLAACLAVQGASGRELQMSEGGPGGAAASLAVLSASAIESLPRGVSLTRAAFARWLRIVARRSDFSEDPALVIAPLEELGLLSLRGDGLYSAKSAASRAGAGKRAAVLVVEGAHALHLMPEAGLEARLFVGSVARPLSIGTVWSFEIERDTVRRAFASGLSAACIKSRFESLSDIALPQSFAFSLNAWEEEYRSLRLYRGYTLVADERQRPLIEQSAALGKISVERLAPGVYFLSAANPEDAIASLAAAGLEAPPLIQAAASPAIVGRVGDGAVAAAFAPAEAGGFSAAPSDGPERAGLAAPAARAAASDFRPRIDALRELIQSSGVSRRDEADEPGTLADPEPRLAELRSALAASGRSEEERRELADRIERRLVLTERQIAQADPRSERLEAGGLDYLGKVRVVERALRATGDRLEVLYRLPGEEPVRAILRPVRLDKNEKGLVLEAEDLSTGGPARVPLGAVSTVRRVRASLFGED